MDSSSVLYQIKSLENLIARNFINNDEEFCSNQVERKRMNIPTSTQMQIIEYILKNVDSDMDVYQKDLEEILNLRRATVSGVLQTMEKNGLIERITDDIDTRTKKIILNERAKEIFMKGQKKIKKIEEIAIREISNEELETFSNVINKMKNNISEEKIN